MDAAVETNTPPRVDRPLWRTPLVAGAVGAAGCAAIAIVNPTDTGIPICWSQGFFGIDCPLCGGLRCVNSLLRGDVAAAADHNILTTIALPVLAVLWAVWMVRSLRGESFRLPKPPVWLMTAAAVVVVAFTIVRNIDGGGFVTWLASTSST